MSKIFKRYKKTKILLIVLISIFIIHQLAYITLTKLGPDTHYTKTLRIYYNLIYNLTSCKDGKIREINNKYLRFKYISFPYPSYSDMMARDLTSKYKNEKEFPFLFYFTIGWDRDIEVKVTKKNWYSSNLWHSSDLTEILENGRYCWSDKDWKEKCIEIDEKTRSDIKKGNITYDAIKYISGLRLDMYTINQFITKKGFKFISFDAKPNIRNNLQKAMYGILKDGNLLVIEMSQESKGFKDYNVIKGMSEEFSSLIDDIKASIGLPTVLFPGPDFGDRMVRPSEISHDKRLACSFKMILDTIEVKDEKSQKSAK